MKNLNLTIENLINIIKKVALQLGVIADKLHLKTLVKFGNKKLPKHTAIFNFGTAKYCPSKALGLCDVCNICYARKAEKQYKAVLPYRIKQSIYWFECTAEQFVSEFLQTIKNKKTKVQYLRINESGDFFTQNCVDKLQTIAKELKKHNIIVYTYTARKDLNFDNCKDVIINGSGHMVNNMFKAIDKDIFDNYQNNIALLKSTKEVNLLCVGDCRKCNLCAQNLGANIFVRKH